VRHELPADRAFVLSRDDSGRFSLVIE
jgi:hypothetical protein